MSVLVANGGSSMPFSSGSSCSCPVNGGGGPGFGGMGGEAPPGVWATDRSMGGSGGLGGSGGGTGGSGSCDGGGGGGCQGACNFGSVGPLPNPGPNASYGPGGATVGVPCSGPQ